MLLWLLYQTIYWKLITLIWLKKYPKIEFRKVAVKLGDGEYLDIIKKATDDIPVTLVFNNAGYIQYKFFATSTIESLLANYNCNSTAMLTISHLFSQRMINEQKKRIYLFYIFSSRHDSRSIFTDISNVKISSYNAWIINCNRIKTIWN